MTIENVSSIRNLKLTHCRLGIPSARVGGINTETIVQFRYEAIDKLTFRELIVRKDIRVMSDDMDPHVHISWDRSGGCVMTYGPKGMGAPSIFW